MGDDFKLYRALRSINPSPYLFYFDFGGFRLLGSSPETHLRVEGRRAYIDPIAGTTRRTGRKEEDDAAARYLRSRPGASLLRHIPRRHAERGAEGEGYGEVTAMSDGQVMAIRHREYDIRGVQFHPESVLTPDGKAILRNWIKGMEAWESA